MMEFGYILIEHFAGLIELHHNPQLRGQPLLLTSVRRSGAQVVVDALNADKCMPGTLLSEAKSNYVNATIIEEQSAKYQNEWENILFEIAQLDIEVEDAGLGRAYVKIPSLNAQGRQIPALTADLFSLIPDWLPARIGIAPGKFPALITVSASDVKITRQTSSSITAFLAAQSVDFLPIPWKMKSRLYAFGLATLGSIASLPLGPFQSQFGRTGKIIWELAQGIDTRPLIPKKFPLAVSDHAFFDSPIQSLHWVAISVDGLLKRIFERPSMQGLQARSCELSLQLSSGKEWHKKMTFQKAINSHSKTLELITASLTKCLPAEPIEEVFVSLKEISGSTGHQGSLFSSARNRDNLAEGFKQLTARLNIPSPLWKIKEMEPWSRIPERRVALVPYIP